MRSPRAKGTAMAELILQIAVHAPNGVTTLAQVPIHIPPGLLLDPRVPEIGDFSTRDLIDELAARLGATEAPHWPAEGDDDGG